MMAATLGRGDVIVALLEAGARVNEQTGATRETALSMATSAGQVAAMRTLIQGGAHVDSINSLQRTPLHSACMFGHTDAVDLLLDNGADINWRDVQGATPLITAVSGTKFLPPDVVRSTNELNPTAVIDHLGVVRTLITRGADVSAKAPNGMNAAGIASRLGDREMMNALGGPSPAKSGCYVATYVYGSYDCPEVWMLRRWRDETLSRSVAGRAAIGVYYSISPVLIRAAGGRRTFSSIAKRLVGFVVARLRARGLSELPYYL